MSKSDDVTRPGREPDSSGKTTSVWLETTPRIETGPLRADARADVCVVGAGIAGMTTAYLLAREGRTVVVLDDGPVGGGETGRTTAHLVSFVDDGFERLEGLHGEEGARLVARSHAAAVDRIEEVVAREAIPCGFERLDGWLFLRPGDRVETLDRELEAARRAGLPVTKERRAPFESYDTGPAIRAPRQAQFHPLRYLAGLGRAIQAAGGRVHTGSHVTEVDESRPARVVTAAGPVVSCDAVVVATNTPVINRVAIHTKQAAYRTYVVGIEVPPDRAPRGLFWDTSEERGDPDPYHYLRVHAEPGGPAVLISGGEDHKTGQEGDEPAAARFARLEAWTRERVPAAGRVVARWSGQVLEPVDSLAFLGRNPGSEDHVYVITGDSGNGMTHGTIGAILVTDLIQGRENPWATLYDPSRKSLRAAKRFLAENVDVAGRFGEWVTAGDVADEEAVPPGGGAIVRRGLAKVAVHRDDEGRLHRLSAVCPHLGCVVHWNGLERTWDCPCHGSRFDATGRVVNGPANRGLSPAGE